MPRVRAGEMRHRVEVQSRTLVRDDIGDTTITWAFEQNRWAKIRQLTAREIEIHSRPEAIATHRIQMRYYDTLKVEQRLVFKGRIFNIQSVNDEWEAQHSTVCIVTEEVD